MVQVRRSRSRFRFSMLCTVAIPAFVILLLISWNRKTSGSLDSNLYSYRLVREYPHDPDAFTQGLLYFENNTLYESTGLYGQSSLRNIDLQTGKVRKLRKLQRRDFGEGLALWKDKLLQLTWQTRKGYIYDRKTFKPLGAFEHPMKDGWGLTTDDKQIIGSDGSSTLYFMEPETFTEIRRVAVTDNGRPVANLNELEYVKGEIWANVWLTECIARISPRDGSVIGWIILQGIRSTIVAAGFKHVDVLNGIAWDAENDRVFVTGKMWPKIYEIGLEPLPDNDAVRAECLR